MGRLGVGMLCVGVVGLLLSRPVAAHALQSLPASSPRSDSSEGPSTFVQTHLLRGTTEAQLGDYQEAIRYYNSALERAPGEPVLLQAIADAYAAREDYTTALFYARKAQEQASDRAYYSRRLAELQRQAGQPQAAVRTYQALIERVPDHEAAYRALAATQAQLGALNASLQTYQHLLSRTAVPPVWVYRKMLSLYRRMDGAEGITRTLQRLVDRRPNNRRYRRLLGEHYAEQGRFEAALNLLRPLAHQRPTDTGLHRMVRRLSKNVDSASTTGADAGRNAPNGTPPSVDQLVRKARALLHAEDSGPGAADSTRRPTVETLLDRALDRNPDHLAALRLRARLLTESGQYVEAGHVLERALEASPRSPERWLRAATAYRKGHAYKQAASVAKEGLLLFPGNARLARVAAWAHLRAGSPTLAREHFQKALDLSQADSIGSDVVARLKAGLGLAYTDLDRPQQANASFEAALSLAPDHPQVLADYALSLARRDDRLDRALTLARRAVNQSPSHARALHALGWVHFQRGDTERARRVLRKALDAHAPSPQLLEHFGDVHHALGNDAMARTYWQKALKKSPHPAPLRKKLEEVSPS